MTCRVMSLDSGAVWLTWQMRWKNSRVDCRNGKFSAELRNARGGAVLADFNDATFIQDGVVTTFTRHDDGFFLRTAGPDGKPGEFEVGRKAPRGRDKVRQAAAARR